MDNDPQGNSTSGLGFNKRTLKKSTYDILINGEDVRNTILKTCVDNLGLCPSNIQLAGAEIELVPAISRETRLKEAKNNTS